MLMVEVKAEISQLHPHMQRPNYWMEIPNNAIVDAIFWPDTTSYVSEFLAMFDVPIVTVEKSRGMSEPHVALRHDVDYSLESAIMMAQLEHSLNLQSTYYLLHPDGIVENENYFGSVVNGRVIIKPTVIDAAKRLVELGHEVGFHNDVISLALATGRDPGDLMREMLEVFSANGIVMKSCVAHGSRLCSEFGYINYQLFKECEQSAYRPPYDKKNVVRNGVVVEKFSLTLEEFGFEYEANFVPRTLTISDSGAAWAIVGSGHSTRIERGKDKRKFQEAFWLAARGAKYTGAIHVLIHPEHWTISLNMNSKVNDAIRSKSAERTNEFNRQFKSDEFVLQENGEKNIIYSVANPRFASYDKNYSVNPQHFIMPSGVKWVAEHIFSLRTNRPERILEVGCGQGEFLELFRESLLRCKNPISAKCLGLDASAAGIKYAAKRYQNCYWIADTFENFIDKRNAGEFTGENEWVSEKFDMILDKTGLTYILKYEDAKRIVSEIRSMLNPGGVYVYVASRAFYINKLKPLQKDWELDWMALLDATFPNVMKFDDDLPDLKGYFKRFYIVD